MRKLRTLIVDDDEDIRLLLSLNFLGGPIEVVGEASDGERGVELALELQPDIIVMDLMMPVMDGAEATTLIKRQMPEVAVFGFTAAEAETSDRLLRAGATGVFSKDKVPALLRTLQHFIDSA